MGHEIGSGLLAARLVRDVMRLAFLLERTYAPYSNWLGAAFARLACVPTLGSQLDAPWPLRIGAIGSTTWCRRMNRWRRSPTRWK